MRLLTILVLVLLAPCATAHGDASSLDGTWAIGPGEEVLLERAIHWHRAMGHVEADGEVVFVANGAVVAGPGKSLTVDHLVNCCDAVWTDIEFSIRNVDDRPVSATANVAFLHDNLAVVVHGAEGGAGSQTLMIVLALIGIPAIVAHRPREGDAARWLLASRMTHGAAWVVAVVTALIGMVRFGSGPVVGSLGSTATSSAGFGDFFNTHSLVMLLAMALWGTAYACLAAARRRGAAPRLDGHIFAVSPPLIAAAMLIELGGFWTPILIGIIPAVAVIADLHGDRLLDAWKTKRRA